MGVLEELAKRVNTLEEKSETDRGILAALQARITDLEEKVGPTEHAKRVAELLKGPQRASP